MAELNDHDSSTTDRQAAITGVSRWLFYTGALGLLGAMSIDALAVIGRHVGIPLLGSIELVQACILLASSAAMLFATVAEKHASVHLLLNRVTPARRRKLQRVHALLSALLFLALAVGSIWVLADLWHGFEESEVLHLPFRPLRVLAIIATLGVALTFVLQAVKKDRP